MAGHSFRRGACLSHGKFHHQSSIDARPFSEIQRLRDAERCSYLFVHLDGTRDRRERSVHAANPPPPGIAADRYPDRPALPARRGPRPVVLMPSTSIRKMEYDLDRRTLSVWFVASGKRYEFEGVPPETFAAFRAAFAKGRYFN
ncbi:KTSC domain-containing protein, partial [Mesorhizobium sp. M0571]|uniref:KTSC domain-containing protein n=1 Tax=Mesorhizobium sp. M0571 TaxID=2956960 RepID=UPI00333692B0